MNGRRDETSSSMLVRQQDQATQVNMDPHIYNVEEKEDLLSSHLFCSVGGTLEH